MKELTAIRWPAQPEWQRPEALALIESTPVNAVLSDNLPKATVDALRARGIEVLQSPPSGVVLLKDCVWPGVQRTGRGGSTTDAGPTGPPWVDANGWAISLARAQNPGKQIWIEDKLPEKQVLRPEHYALAVADAEAYGGRWVIDLDPLTQKALIAGEGQARETWSTLIKTLRFFSGKREAIAAAQPLARLGVVSDFAGENEFMGHEVLNLAARRHLAYRIVVRPRLDLDGLAAVLWIHGSAPEGDERKALMSFVNEGGTLIVPSGAAQISSGLKAAGTSEPNYPLFASGKGRIAVAPSEWEDPYMVATDAHRIMTRRHDVFRLWNAAASNAVVGVNGQRALAQIINFTGRPVGHPMSLWVAVKAPSARFEDLFGRVDKLKTDIKSGGSEINLPPFTAYAAIEFGEGV